MDESELASTGFTDASTLSGSTSNNRESGRPCSSPTCLIRRYQKNSAVSVSSSMGAELGMSRELSLSGRLSERAVPRGSLDTGRMPDRYSLTYDERISESSQGCVSPRLASLTPLRMSVDGRAAAVTLTNESIFIQYSNAASCPCLGVGHEDIPYSEILTAELQGLKKATCLGYPFAENVYGLCVYSFGRSVRNPSVWFPRRLVFTSSAGKAVETFHALILDAVRTFECRPKNLLVLINPYGGNKRAPSVYEQNVLPVFDKANIKSSRFMTAFRGNAKDIVHNLSKRELEELDGIVAVGGDGLFHEIVNALLEIRSEDGSRSECAGDIKVGHIPAGSTDAVACTLNGTRSAFTAAMHIALGDSMPLDVLRIDSVEGNTEYAVSMASYGFMGDLMEASERFRWMGPMRYEIMGALMLATNRSYRATIEYLPAPEGHSSLSSKVCTRNCLVCSQPSHERLNTAKKSFKFHAQESLSRLPQEWKKIEGEYSGIMLVIMPCRSEKSSKGVAKYGHLNDGNVHLVLVKKCSRWQYLKFLMRLSSHGLEVGTHNDNQIDVVHVVAVKITHLQNPTKTSIWNIDGELLKSSGIVAESHRGVIQVFARGIEDK